MAGATQRHVPCPHLEDGHYYADFCMASQVSSANLHYFLQEKRVADDVDRADLEEWLTDAEEADAVLVVCNACDRVLQVDSGDVVVHHAGWDAEEPEEVTA